MDVEPMDALKHYIQAKEEAACNSVFQCLQLTIATQLEIDEVQK